MVLFKVSSQLTNWLMARNPGTASKYLDQIVDAFEHLGSLGSGDDFNWARMTARFHKDESQTDAVMRDSLVGPDGDNNEANIQIDEMYKVLGRLEHTGLLDINTRKTIEKFLSDVWKPLTKEENTALPSLPEEVRPGVTRRKRRETPQIQVELEAAPAKWERAEESMIRKLDKNVFSVYDVGLFVKADILEIVPDFEEREVRLAERQYEWAKFAER